MNKFPVPPGPLVELTALDDTGFLEWLRSHGIGIVAAEERLRITAPPGLLTDVVKDELRRRKSSLVGMLQRSPSEGAGALEGTARSAGKSGQSSLQGQIQGQLEQVRYWKSKLAGVPALLELPFSQTRPPVKSAKSATVPLRLPPGPCRRLREIAASAGEPFSDGLAALVAVLFYRYTGQEDFCIGVPAGAFNQVAVRCQPRAEMSFRAMVRQVRATAMEALTYKTLPFQQLVGHLAPVTEPGVPPIFQAMVVVTKAGLPFDERQAGTIASTGLDLIVHVTDEGEGGIEYSSDLFRAGAMEQMARTLGALLESAVERPDRAIAELDLLGAEERQRVLIEWNRTALEISAGDLIHNLFERQAASMPGALAVIAGDTQLTYRQLNERANRLANLLIQRGLQPEECVGVCLQRTSELIVALLAILKAGGAYVPLDPAYPAARIEAMLSDSRARLVICESASAGSLDGAPGGSEEKRCELLFVDREAEAIAAMPNTNPGLLMGRERLAYVIYTSGSTGRPKGVAIEHHSAVSLMHWGKMAFKPEELARVVAATSVCFDLSVFEMFLPLSWGYTVVLAGSPLEIVAAAQAAKATMVNTVPSAVAAALASDSFPRSVRCVNMAGEPLATALVQLVEKRQLEQGKMVRGQMERRSATVRVVDLYGPTETTTYSTASQRRGDLAATIGRPIANTSVYLLDARMQPVPVGVPGQICIGGEGVARGYLGQPEMTAQRFVTVTELAGAPRLYLTGDLARYRPDGCLEYMGRMDNQVKLRGFRIELGEIEGVLRSHPEVSEAVVMVRRDEATGDTLVAFVVVAGGVEPAVAELVALQREVLPVYMVVSEIVYLDELPLTLNGKIDRKLLAGRKSDTAARNVPVDAPLSEVERVVLSIWERHFKRSPIGTGEDFFALGGHSLLALKIFSEIEKTLDAPMMLSVLFKAPTVRLLAREIEAERAKG